MRAPHAKQGDFGRKAQGVAPPGGRRAGPAAAPARTGRLSVRPSCSAHQVVRAVGADLRKLLGTRNAGRHTRQACLWAGSTCPACTKGSFLVAALDEVPSTSRSKHGSKECVWERTSVLTEDRQQTTNTDRQAEIYDIRVLASDGLRLLSGGMRHKEHAQQA